MTYKEQLKTEHPFQVMAVELENYFLDRVVNGDFEVVDTYQNSIDIKMCDYHFAILINDRVKAKGLITTFDDSFMRLDFESLTEDEKCLAFNRILTILNNEK